jgi:hypothetical protein
MILDFVTEAEVAAWIEMDARHEVSASRCGERLPRRH